MIQRLRLSRTRTALAAFAIGLVVGSSLVTSGDAGERQVTRSARSSCGHYPEASAGRDCFVTQNRDAARRFMAGIGGCIADAEGSGWRSISSAGHGGRFQLTQSAADSVGPNRLDGIHPARAPEVLQKLDARRLYKVRGLSPWPPARHC